MVSFQQAAIRIEKEKEFEELKSALVRVFCAEKVEKFLKRVQSKGLRIRDFDSVLARGVIDAVDDGLDGSKITAKHLYQTLGLSDQAQMREFYLFKVEEVSQELRTRFQKVYRYY